MVTPDRWQSKTFILSANVDRNRVFATGDKCQSKTLFLAFRSAFADCYKCFNCRLSGVVVKTWVHAFGLNVIKINFHLRRPYFSLYHNVAPVARKLVLLHATNKGSGQHDQPVLPRRLVSACVIRFLVNIIAKYATCKI